MTFYELFAQADTLDEVQRRSLGLHLKKKRLVYVNKAICVLAKRPFFAAFKKFLMHIYKVTTTRDTSAIPIERCVPILWFVMRHSNFSGLRTTTELFCWSLSVL